jgi:peptide/nickel transport system permease protein
VIAIPLGLFTAAHSRSAIDRTALLAGIVAISLPTFWLGRLLQHYLGYRWGLFPVGGSADLRNLPLPALTLGIGGAFYYARLLHSSLLGVMNQNYIRAARARGLSERMVMSKHALKNALIPLVTLLGMDIASLLSGLIFTEKIFGWPGIGSLAVDSVLGNDVPMIMGTVMFAALMVVVASILIDIAYLLIDPRMKID